MFLAIASASLFQATFVQGSSASSNWQMNLTFQANNGTQVSSSPPPIFAPFDLIQITSTITNQNQTDRFVLVSFEVEGPANSSYPIQLIRTATTDQTGKANMTFRIPLDTDQRPVFGTWSVFADANSSQGVIQQNATFQVGWPITISSITLLNANGQNQTVFKQGDTVTAVLTLNCTQPRATNVTLTALDSAGNQIAQTQLQNQILNKTTNNHVNCTFKISGNASPGQAIIEAATFSGTFQGVAIASSETKTTYFTIAAVSPTPPPKVTLENAVSLFSWLLVATGLFTFTSLLLLLRRKPPASKTTSNVPGVPPESPGPTVSTSSGSATAMILEPSETRLPQEAGPHGAKPSSIQELLESQILSQLNEIEAIATRIEALKAELKLERENLAKNLSEFNRTIQEQEKATNSYFDSIEAEIARLENLLADKQGKGRRGGKKSKSLEKPDAPKKTDEKDAEDKGEVEKR